MKRKIVFLGVTLLAIGIVLIVFSLAPFPFQTQEPYDVPQSSTLLEESFTVPVGQIDRTVNLREDDEINIDFRCTSGGNLDVNFYARQGGTTLLSLNRVTSYNQSITIPNNGTCSFTWITALAYLHKNKLLQNYPKFGMK